MWAIRKEDLTISNPPVWGNYGSETDPDWVLETETLSDFWLYIAIYNGVMGGLRYNANAMGGWKMEDFEVPTGAVAHIENNIPNSPLSVGKDNAPLPIPIFK